MKNVIRAASAVFLLALPVLADNGAVYVQSNSASGNQMIAWNRARNGTLSDQASFSTGGAGLDTGLGSQGSVTLSPDERWLFVANAGSNDVSVFSVLAGTTPFLTDVEPSLGLQPISVAVQGPFVYVLNAGSATVPATVVAFRLSPVGSLSPINAIPTPLSQDAPGPAQVGIDRNSGQVIVTEKMTDTIDLFPILASGELGAPSFVASNGATPFGFTVTKNGTLLVSEAFGGAMDMSALSSYSIGQGSLSVVSPSVPTTETAACWAVATKDGRFTYVTNTGSGTVTGYAVDPTIGALAILDADGVTGDLGTGANPIDAAFTRTSRHLYVLSPMTGEIDAFRLSADGSLTEIAGVDVPTTSAGLAAR